MRSPICDICGADASGDGGGPVTFKPLGSDAAWLERADRGDIVGHPTNVAWLCDKHGPQGRELARTHVLGAALAQIRATDAPSAPGMGVAIEIGELERRLRDVFARVANGVGLAEAPVTKSDERRWTPMDASEPPNCPFTDVSTREASHGGSSLTLTFERAHWNPHEIARASLTFVAHGTESDFRLSAATPDSGSLVVDKVVTKGAIPATIASLLANLSLAP
jgi:hypothetical protein